MAKASADGKSVLRRRRLFFLHVLLYVVGSTLIWTLNAPQLDKQFDVVLWLALLCAHGLIVFHRRRIAFLFHLLMFSAGNAAIWSTTARSADKLTVNIAWGILVAIVGIWLFRRHALNAGRSPKPAARKPRANAKQKPAPVEEIDDDDVNEAAFPDYDAASIDDTPPPRRRSRRNAEG